MDLVSARHGDTLVLSPRGRIDHASAEAFKAVLEPHLAASGPARLMRRSRRGGAA